MDKRLELTLTIHGLDEYNQDVDGEVFARKLGAFVRGLAAADKAANGKRVFKFLLTDLSKNTATASLREQVAVKGSRRGSGLSYYVAGVEAIYDNTPRAKDLPAAFVREVVALNKGVGHTFSFGEIKSNENFAIRVDEFLESRAEAILSSINHDEGLLSETDRAGFSGVAFVSLDGVLKAVDLRGVTQKAALVLTAGGKQIECVVNTLAVSKLRDALDRRVTVYGRAHYEGASGLPTRLDVRDVRIFPERTDADLARWRGHFRIPADASEEDVWG